MSSTDLPWAFFGLLLLGPLSGCAGNGNPSGPRIVIAPSYSFSPGQMLTYTRQNYDQNHNPTSWFQHDVEILASGLTIGGFADAATAVVSTSGGGMTRSDTVGMAFEGGKLLIYDHRGPAPGRYPPLPLWSTLIDMRLDALPDTILSFDSTFTLTMASGSILSDRVTCSVVTRYLAEEVIAVFGAPIVNSFIFLRTVYCGETVDTAGVLLFQGPVISLLDSVWFANDIGPVRFSSRGSTLEIDSLGLPFSLSALQVVHTPSSHDSYEVHYARVDGREVLALRESLYERLGAAYTVISGVSKNF